MKPNDYVNNPIVQTPISQAYHYETHSDYIKKIKPVIFSFMCIFCSNPESIALLNDGSFRRCIKCRKDFKAKIIS